MTAMRFTALVSAVAIYAFAGSPSPDHPGLPEVLIALLLITAAGFPAIMNMFLFKDRTWRQAAGQIFLLYGLLIILPLSVMYGNDASLIARDLPAFLFLLLPLLCGDIFQKRPEYANIFIWIFVFLGLMFALRSLFETSLFNRSLVEDSRELYYFANSPAVLFAAVIPAGLAIDKYLRTLSFRSVVLLGLSAGATLLPLMSMAVTLQRASIAWVIVSLGIFMLMGFGRTPYRALFLLILVFIAALPFFTYGLNVLEMLTHKTAIYGVNKRGMEMEAVWREISASGSPLFGLGWGGTFESPAVGDMRINYTHSFVSGMLLKSGIIGAMLACLYISGFFVSVLRILSARPVPGMALAGPLAIDAILYASYKWLDFGLLLLLISAAAQLHRPAAYCIQNRPCEDLQFSS
jgi:hypothetical protein